MSRGDVKGLLLRALQELGAAKLTDSTVPLTQHLQAVEAQQATNLLAFAHGAPVQFQVPLFLGPGQSSTMMLGVSPDEEGKVGPDQKSTGHNIMMHLELSELGETRIDAHLTPTAVRAIFYIENSTGRAIVQDELPVLREALNGLGFHDVLLAVRSTEELPIRKQRDFAALSQGLPSSGSLLDVKG